MGDPRKIRKKYTKPRHPWVKVRIEEDKELKKTFGIPRNREVWKMETILTTFKNLTKKLAVLDTAQAEKEREHLRERLQKYGLITKDDPLDKTLSLTLATIMERRLQTVVCRLGLAQSMKQARQFITHRHITINGKIVTSPSYLVPVAEEASVRFTARSAMADPEHPTRAEAQSATEVAKEKETLQKSAELQKEEKQSEPAAKPVPEPAAETVPETTEKEPENVEAPEKKEPEEEPPEDPEEAKK